MKTYRDILRYRIKNKKLLERIEYYHETIPYRMEGMDNFLSSEIDEEFCDSTNIRRMLICAFTFRDTEEGFFYWDLVADNMAVNDCRFIYEWKHVDEWLKEFPERIRKRVETGIDTLASRMGCPRKLLNFVSLSHLCTCIWIHVNMSENTEYFKLLEFIRIHDRIPNDFDQ